LPAYAVFVVVVDNPGEETMFDDAGRYVAFTAGVVAGCVAVEPTSAGV
jgi:hypothetical protein